MGASHSKVVRKDIKFNSLKARYIKESQGVEDKIASSGDKEKKDSTVAEMKDSFIQEKSPKSCNSSASSSPKKKNKEIPKDFDKMKSLGREKPSSLPENMKKRKSISDSSGFKDNKVPKSSKSLSKERSSEPDDKKKKPIPDKDSRGDNLDHGKSYNRKEFHKKEENSSKKRESSGSRSSTQERHRKKHRTSESSSRLGSTPEKVSSKIKSREEFHERNKTEESSVSSGVHENKEEAKKKPTPVGSCKKGRVSRLSAEGQCESFASGKMKETLDRIKIKDKNVTERRRSWNPVNESVSLKKIAENKVEGVIKVQKEKHSSILKDAKPIGQEATKPKASTSSSAHPPGDYLGRKLLKIARDAGEKEKRIISEVQKPASAVQRKNKTSAPPVTTPAAPVADILAINASIPIDVHLFENIEKEPLPPAPAIIPKVFPQVLQDNFDRKSNEIPLICEAQAPLNSMDIDSPDDYDETCSINSVETVILQISPRESETIEQSPPASDETSLSKKIIDLASQQEEFEKILKDIGLLEGSETSENIVEESPDNSDKLAAKEPIVELKPENKVEITAEVERLEKKHKIHTAMKSQSMMPIIIMPVQMMPSDYSNQLQNNEKAILYEDILHLIHVTKYHRKRMEALNVLEFEPQVKSLCETFIKSLEILKNKEEVTSDEDITQSIVEHSLHLSRPFHVEASDISWILKNSPARLIAPVPPPVPKINQRKNPQHLPVAKNKLSSGNKMVNSSAYSHLPNNQVPHSERIVPNQSMKLPRPMPSFNYQNLEQRREFTPTQHERQMNMNVQPPPLPSQPFSHAPPPPPPMQQNIYQQQYNNQGQFMENERMVPQQMPQQMQSFPQCPQQYPQQFNAYVGAYLNQPQFTSYQFNSGHYQNIQPQLNQGSYQVPLNPMNNFHLGVQIPEDIKMCFSRQCAHPNCERYLMIQQLHPQAGPNRDPRWRGAQVPQVQEPPIQNVTGTQRFHAPQQQYPQYAQPQVPQTEFCAGNQMSELKSKVPENSIQQLPKSPTITEGHPSRFFIGEQKEMASPMIRNPQAASNNDISTEKKCIPHSDVKDKVRNTEKVKKESIDVIDICSSDDEEEPEVKHSSKIPRVDDEIECVGIANKLGIKLDESPEPGTSGKSQSFPVIERIMTIPMTDYERMNIMMEKDEIEVKDELPMEMKRQAPKCCIVCQRRETEYCCKNCDAELFCSEACAEKSDHVPSCYRFPLVKIEDD